jgi:predicted NBD/HSP70 family sugar kinase
MDIVIVGIDLGKNSCSLAGLDASGRVVLRRRMRRSALGSFVTSLRALSRPFFENRDGRAGGASTPTRVSPP